MRRLPSSRMPTTMDWRQIATSVICFVFTLDGCISCRVLKAPGSWHDAEIAKSGGLYEALQNVDQQSGCKIIDDSKFPRNFPYIARSSKVSE